VPRLRQAIRTAWTRRRGRSAAAAGAPSIAIVVVFFGGRPFWLPAFLLSCRHNPDVQWIVYCDFDVADTLPPNVSVKRLDIPEFNRRASDVLGAAINVLRTSEKADANGRLRINLRKACDLKPAYGVIFAEDLRRYDFWACSDLDIVWGDVRHFLTPALLRGHDIISSRPDRLSGHFTLYRNTPATNRAFELIPNVAAAFAEPRYLHLDEHELTRHLRQYMDEHRFRRWPRVYWQHEWTTSAGLQHSIGHGDMGPLCWRDGKTFTAAGTEIMYVHFHKLKRDMTTIDFGFDDAPAAFSISRTGFAAWDNSRLQRAP